MCLSRWGRRAERHLGRGGEGANVRGSPRLPKSLAPLGTAPLFVLAPGFCFPRSTPGFQGVNALRAWCEAQAFYSSWLARSQHAQQAGFTKGGMSKVATQRRWYGRSAPTAGQGCTRHQPFALVTSALVATFPSLVLRSAPSVRRESWICTARSAKNAH
jgi:hypothetical protein